MIVRSHSSNAHSRKGFSGPLAIGMYHTGQAQFEHTLMLHMEVRSVARPALTDLGVLGVAHGPSVGPSVATEPADLNWW
jgi:hypothetical protein